MTAEGRALFEEHLRAPRGLDRLPDAEHAGAAGGSACGDLIRVAVRVDEAQVVETGFSASGCGALRAAGSAVVELVEGVELLDAARLTPELIATALGGLAPAHRHAADLAADALHRALGMAVRDGSASLPRCADRTLVAMSGGVDSAVAAQLALDAGHDVVGVTLELWSDPATDGTRSCCSPQAVTGARALAHGMGLPHLTLDLRAPFGDQVVDDFVSEHAVGRTPNPCVRCNGHVRFDAMLRAAGDLGAVKLATGHYARVEEDEAGPLLRVAADPAKDQTYMLSRLCSEELARLWFPLGELEKPAVRELARSAGLAVADRVESQDLCFLAGTRREPFLRRHRGRARVASADGDLGTERPGAIVDEHGSVLGSHGGHERFTVGQRRGIGIGAPEALYVIRKEPARNRVVVGPRSALATTRVSLGSALLHRPAAVVDRVKLRYRSTPVPCTVEQALPAGDHERLTLTLSRPVEGVAPGQTACLMHGEVVVGSATIDDEPRSPNA